MALSFDHAIIAVDDLETAKASFGGQGFHVLAGGEHLSGTTHNALVVFQNGTYLELLAATGKEPDPSVQAADFRPLLSKGEGWVGYALQSNRLARDIDAMRKRGLEINEPKAGSRKLANGDFVRWQTAMLPDGYSPFIIQDETPRDLRVPTQKAQRQHKNSASGIVNVQFVVESLEIGIERYSKLLGSLPRVDDESAVFTLDDDVTLTLLPPINDEMSAHLQERGDVPYEVTIRTNNPRPTTLKIHKAQIELTARGEVRSSRGNF